LFAKLPRADGRTNREKTAGAHWRTILHALQATMNTGNRGAKIFLIGVVPGDEKRGRAAATMTRQASHNAHAFIASMAIFTGW
jgi:hypothetical protein